MRIPFTGTVCTLVFLCLFCAGQATAAVSLNTANKVSRGDAFLVTASSDEAVEHFVFGWRGQQYTVKAAAADGQYGAQILLPVSLDEKKGQLTLTLTARAVASGEKLQTSRRIKIYSKKRPVSQLRVDKKFVSPPKEVLQKIESDRAKVRQALKSTEPEVHWTLPLARPLAGSVSSVFGVRRMFNGKTRSVHRGLDLRGATGTPIHACADGRVVLAEHLYYAGNAVYINHGGGVITSSMHMSRVLVRPGQLVRRGEVIGLVGATGRVTGPHLHLGFHVQGQLVDPLPWLAPRFEPQSTGAH